MHSQRNTLTLYIEISKGFAIYKLALSDYFMGVVKFNISFSSKTSANSLLSITTIPYPEPSISAWPPVPPAPHNQSIPPIHNHNHELSILQCHHAVLSVSNGCCFVIAIPARSIIVPAASSHALTLLVFVLFVGTTTGSFVTTASSGVVGTAKRMSVLTLSSGLVHDLWWIS